MNNKWPQANVVMDCNEVMCNNNKKETIQHKKWENEKKWTKQKEGKRRERKKMVGNNNENQKK